MFLKGNMINGREILCVSNNRVNEESWSDLLRTDFLVVSV